MRKPRELGSGKEKFYSPSTAISEIVSDMDSWEIQMETLNWPTQYDTLTNGQGVFYFEKHFNSWTRFCLVTVLVVDVALGGLEVLKALPNNWPGKVLCLVDGARDLKELAALTVQRIDSFVVKGVPSLMDVIRCECDKLHTAVCDKISQALWLSLSPIEVKLLTDPRIKRTLDTEIGACAWDEYVVVGKPFGIMGCAFDGPLQWLQLETQESLEALAQAAEARGYDKMSCSEIEVGSVIPPFRMNDEFGRPGRPQLIRAEPFSDSPLLVGAVTDMGIRYHSGEDEEIRQSKLPTDQQC